MNVPFYIVERRGIHDKLIRLKLGEKTAIWIDAGGSHMHAVSPGSQQARPVGHPSKLPITPAGQN